LHSLGQRIVCVTLQPMTDAVNLSNNPAEYAAQLYDTLHKLDEGGYDRLLIEMPLDTAEWVAVRDRLQRAASE
jgi:L-threonylcarbamoyladenylate synthase